MNQDRLEIKPNIELFKIKDKSILNNYTILTVTNDSGNKEFKIENTITELFVGDDVAIAYIINDVLSYQTKKMYKFKLTSVFINEKKRKYSKENNI